jgi:hypothetical protein
MTGYLHDFVAEPLKINRFQIRDKPNSRLSARHKARRELRPKADANKAIAGYNEVDQIKPPGKNGARSRHPVF